MQELIPRVILAGTSSGCGKTTITCGLLQALVNRNIKTASFKCGPDYIDPMFHEKIIGTKSSNLDPFFFDDKTLKYLLYKNSKESDISIIEGVMGFYDGMSLNTSEGSTHHLSNIIKAPVILTVNCKGLANSALAIIKGFSQFKADSNIKGVILNNISKTTYKAVKLGIELEFNNEITVLGYLPKLPDKLIFESRHLGLITANEIENVKEKMNQLANIATETLDIEGIISLAKTAGNLEINPIAIEENSTKITIAVAKDSAFCFYYKDNLALLTEMGAKIKYFSPIYDDKLPADIDALYIGGGYPELYATELSGNTSMLKSIKTALENKIPCLAECGGFMYLNNTINDTNMVGFLKGDCVNMNTLTRFGYITMKADKDNLLCKKGESIKAHEFHYYDCSENGDSFSISKLNGKNWKGVVCDDFLYAGFPHIHFYGNLNFAKTFYGVCAERKKKNDQY